MMPTRGGRGKGENCKHDRCRIFILFAVLVEIWAWNGSANVLFNHYLRGTEVRIVTCAVVGCLVVFLGMFRDLFRDVFGE